MDRPKIVRHKATVSGLPGFSANFLATFMIAFPIFFCWFCFITIHNYGGSLQLAGQALLGHIASGDIARFLWSTIPRVTFDGACFYFGWIFVQAMFYLFMPGPSGYGQMTPGGNVLKYHCNGLNSWIVTHIAAVTGVYFGVFQGTIIFDNLGSFFVLANLSGLALSFFALFKAYNFPTHAEDRRFSDSLVYDFFMGIEHNPRIGNLDFKLFFNGRPGILAWTLINLSCAAKQFQLYGHVTNSMIIVNVLHAMYVVDYFYKEDWYLRTIDIAHDHFGFYLAWGDLTWLPFMYTIQCYFLVHNPVQLSVLAVLGISVLGGVGYFIFRSVNSQKDNFRIDMQTKGKSIIWGKPAKYIPATYYTTDGKLHKSPLLMSGWWGLSRHFNYVGDLMGSLAYCLPCGFTHLLPYFYIIYMTILLVHRVYRDDVRCREKYREFWDRYCKEVPYRIVPYIY
ncbi:7-dehydrocholesterol reductase-like [Rhopilema esculentum]|uniref:7-dehydrocholesterol reductase-like n=1 Tax=Rhopilema esculentum TaxID=499914 RepID=UPI0031D0319D|eukprot:gene14793-5900_t